MPFASGQSGNPGGRPRMPDELRKAFQDTTLDALNTLKDVMHNGEKGAERVKAAEVLLSRAWGTPEQAVTLNGGLAVAEVDTSKLPKDAQESLLTALVGIVGNTSENPVD